MPKTDVLFQMQKIRLKRCDTINRKPDFQTMTKLSYLILVPGVMLIAQRKPISFAEALLSRYLLEAGCNQ